MPDIKEIRRKLWYSLDMLAVKKWFFGGLFLAIFVALMVFLKPTYLTGPQKTVILVIMELISAVPFFVFCAVRTFRIFSHPESYTFCQTKLSQPKGGRIRNTIRFKILIEDADGKKFAADTHSIFATNGIGWPLLEDYVNQIVTAAYNEETGMLVIIG